MLKQWGIAIGIGLITGFIVFESFVIYFQFLVGVVKLSGGYGDTLSLHSENNW